MPTHTSTHTHSNLRRGFATSTRDAVKSLHDRANTPTRNTSGRAPRTALQVSHQVPAPPVPPPPQFFRAQLARQEPHRQRVVGQRCDAQVRCRVNRRLRPLAAADEAVRDLCVCVCVYVCVCVSPNRPTMCSLTRSISLCVCVCVCVCVPGRTPAVYFRYIGALPGWRPTARPCALSAPAHAPAASARSWRPRRS